MIVVFDSFTDQSGFSAGVIFDCDLLLDFPDVNFADCAWVDPVQLMASVSRSVSFLPETSNVTLQAGVLKGACDDGYRCECLDYANASTAVA